MSGLPNGSASSAERMLECPASLVLPQTIFASSVHAARGTDLHGFSRGVLTGVPMSRALAMVEPEHQAVAKNIDFAKIGGDLTEVRCEVSYAIDVRARSSRFLGVDIKRGYERFGITIDEITGSDDLEGKRRDDAPEVLDLKFGWEPVEKAEHNVQLKTYVTARAWETGAPMVEGRIVKFDQEGNARPDRYEFDQLAIDLFADELEEGINRVRKAELVYAAGHMPTVAVGPWCRWCPSLNSCPAHVSLARSMLSELATLEERIASLTPVEGGQAWLRLDSIDDLSDRIRTGLKALAVQTPLPTSAWKHVEARHYPSRKLDQGAALALLRAKGATDEELAALYRITQIEKVAEVNQPGKKAPRGKPKKRGLPMLDAAPAAFDGLPAFVAGIESAMFAPAGDTGADGAFLTVEEMQAMIEGGTEP